MATKNYQPSAAQIAFYARGDESMRIAMDLVRAGAIVVGEDGRIWHATFHGKPAKRLRPAEIVVNSGYYHVCFYHQEDGAKRQRKVLAHRLVWTALRGPIPPGMQINHIDGDKQNNHPDNIEVVDQSGNMLHRCHVLGKKSRPPRKAGADHNMARLNEGQVREMRRLYDAGSASVPDLVCRFDISDSQARRIVKRQSWMDAM